MKNESIISRIMHILLGEKSHAADASHENNINEIADIKISEIIDAIPEPYKTSLLDLHAFKDQEGSDGELHQIDKITLINPEQGMRIHELCLKIKPVESIEVGLAYGYSTIYILAAMHLNGFGKHTAIDPYQIQAWNGIGLNLAKKHACMVDGKSNFEWIADRSDRAIVDMARAGRKFDFIYIDGNHRFDDVIVDFYLSDQICQIGGHIMLDDLWMGSIKTAVDFIHTNRTNYESVSSGYENIALFKKTGEDNRPWNEFFPFKVWQ